MIWKFRGFTTFSLYPYQTSGDSLESDQSDSGPVPLNPLDASTNYDSPSASNHSTVEDGLASSQDHETRRTYQITSELLCTCERQAIDFCPYCDYERTVLLEEPAIQHTPPLLTSPSGSIPSSSRRKLRKFRNNYHQLYIEALPVESILAARPDTIVSIDSRTPLSNTFISTNLNYPALPPVHRSRRKLEKKDKKAKSASTLGLSALVASPNTIQRPRIITQKSFQKSKSREALGPRPTPVSGSIYTDTLVSLAWTGEASSPSRSPETLALHPASLSSSLLRPSRPSSIKDMDLSSSQLPPYNTKRSFLRKPRDSDEPVASPTRPWTFAMTITDDCITDERLVHDLEDMRIKDVDDSIISDPYPLGLGPPPFYQTQLYDSYAEYPLQAGETSQEDTFSVDASWNVARQVFLLCREFVRTERRYLASLKTLITNGTSTPVPLSMLPYLPRLITASDQLLERMEGNPSVQGVSDAFLACEDLLKQSFIDWCSIVGEFFDCNEKMKATSGPEDSSPSRPGRMRTESNLLFVIPEPNKIRKNTKSRPTVRDLAILPTQRIMRYVLLFKEFYSLTPTTVSSFAAVVKALQAAQSIANAANEAQGHSAFDQPPIRIL